MLSTKLLCTLALVTASSYAKAATVKKVDYEQGGEHYEGLFVYPDHAKGSVPGVLMVHNWMGVTDETKAQAERVAKLGYAVFVADIFGKGIRPKNADEASKLAGKYKGDRKVFREHLQAGLTALKAQKGVDTKRLLAVGYCFGGTGVLELARSGADLKGVATFHAGLDSPTPEDGKNIKAHVIVFHGADDPFEKPEDLAAFEAEMRNNKVDWQEVRYGGTVHSFTDKGAGSDNSKGQAYNAKSDARSFAAFKDFAAQTL